MIVKRTLINAVLPALRESERGYELGSIQIRPDGTTVATNGHIIIKASDAKPFPDAEFPLIPGAPFTSSPEAPILVRGDVAKRLIAATPKRTTLPILAGVQVSTFDGGSTLAATDLDAPCVMSVKSDPEVRFPDVDRLYASAEGKADTLTMIVALDVLETMLKSARAIVDKSKRTPTVSLTIPIPKMTKPSETEPSVRALQDEAFTFEAFGSDSDIKVSGLAMPCRR